MLGIWRCSFVSILCHIFLAVIFGWLSPLQEHMAKRQALEAESSKAKESYVELEIEVRKLRKEKEEDASQLAALQQHWEARLAEAAVRVKEAESRSVSQRERDMQSLKHLQVELEKALGTVSGPGAVLLGLQKHAGRCLVLFDERASSSSHLALLLPLLCAYLLCRRSSAAASWRRSSRKASSSSRPPRAT